MVYIFKDRLIRVEWTIYKGISPVKEDFSRSNVKVFLLGNREKYLLQARADKGTLYVDIPSGLEAGAYSIEAIWVKNMDHFLDTRSICRSKKEDLFSITEFEDEATNIGEGVVVLKVKTSTATYGYDGLSSYELAVLRGDWNGTEGEWLKHERYVSVLDSRGDSEVDTMSQKAITDELEAQDNAIEDIREDTGKLGERVEEAEEKVNNMGDVVDEIKSHAPVSARPAGFKPDIDLTPEITVDRAWRDHEGNVIRDTYITRRGLRNEIIDITNQQVTDLKPGSVDPDDLSEATKQLIGNKSITNLPDEEDITVTENQTLKLKDKEYAPKDYSGMGRVYLRKHYVNGVNTLTQHMMRKPNTIYIIQYDYCLAGQTIEVPENCVLDFQGGSLRDGTLIGEKSSILAPPSNTIFKDIIIEGVWFVSDIYDTWFYLPDTYQYISNSIIKSILSLSNDNCFNTIHFSSDRDYWFENSYKGKANLGDYVRPLYAKLDSEEFSFLRIFTGITSNSHVIINSNIRMIPQNQGVYYVFHVLDKCNIEISGNGGIYGDAHDHIYDTPFVSNSDYYGEFGALLSIISCKNVIIRDITLSDGFGDCLAITAGVLEVESETIGRTIPPTKGILVDNVKIWYARRNGIWIGAHDALISKCYFKGCGSDEIRGTAPKAGIDFESDYIAYSEDNVCKNIIMSSCVFENNSYDISSTNATTKDAGDYAVCVYNCLFTAPLRLNTTFWLRFSNCDINYISNVGNSINYYTASQYLLFEDCNFRELHPYLVWASFSEGSKFINCHSPEDSEGMVKFLGTLKSGNAYKISIPKYIFSEIEFTAFASGEFLSINTTKYTTGDIYNNAIRDVKISYNRTSTPYTSVYINSPIFSNIIDNVERNTYDIYLSMGANILESPLSSNVGMAVYYVVKSKYSILKEGESTGPGIGYPPISGGEYTKPLNIKVDEVTYESIKNIVSFPRYDIFKTMMSKDLPLSLDSYRSGEYFFLLDNKFPVFWDSYTKTFRTSDGYVFRNRRVNYENLEALKEILTSDDSGITFWLFSHETKVTWDGTKFINMDGTLTDKAVIV